jgi:Flp pilus assembly protein TadD
LFAVTLLRENDPLREAAMSWIARILAVTAILSTAVPSWAGFIRGQVLYVDHRPADHVIVRLRSDKADVLTETQTDALGRFNFDGLPLSTFHLTIEGQGFHPYSSDIDISMSRQAFEQITLRLEKEPGTKEVPAAGTVNARIAQIPAEASKEFGLGKQRMQAQDGSGSIEHFQKSIALYPNYAEAYQLLGVVHMEMGKFIDAEPELQKAAELEPKLATAYFALGICRNQLAKYPEAEVALAHGLELEPNSADGHYHIAEAYWNLGRFDDSEPHARKALALNPDMAPAHVLVGNSMLRKRDAPGALKEFKEYLRLAPRGEFAPATSAAVERLEKGLQQAANPK